MATAAQASPPGVVSGLTSGLPGTLGAIPSAPAIPAAPAPSAAVPYSRRELAATAASGTTAAAQSAAATPAVTTVTGSAGLVINLVWDSGVSNAPPSFKAAVVQAAQMIGATVTNRISVNIAVGCGEVGGSPIPSGSSEAAPLGDRLESYATVKQQLTVACGTTAIGQSVVAHLPATNPFGSRSYDVSGAELKVFGVDAANGTALDGEVGFSTDWPSSDLVAAALHELTHAMGRNSGWGSAANGYDITPLDLTRYSAPGVLVCDGSVATAARLQYLSVNGGTTVLADYSNTSDYGDWASNSLTVRDPYNAYVSSNSNSLTSVDIAALDAIGYTTVTAVAAGSGGVPVAATPAAIAANQSINQTTGVVTGALGFTNPGTSTVSYTVTTNPANGKVTVSTTGTYTYTPNASARVGAPGTPLTDSFTVTATNATGATAETVTARITGRPIAVTPATIAANQSSNRFTGVVTGSLGFTNPDTGTMTYAVTTNPANGKVSVSTTGTYTYTPNSPVRFGTALTDSFTVTATNATGGTPETVNVSISGFSILPLRVL